MDCSPKRLDNYIIICLLDIFPILKFKFLHAPIICKKQDEIIFSHLYVIFYKELNEPIKTLTLLATLRPPPS